MSDNPTDVGLLLKQERERKGISLDVVHEATKVPMDALRAIEEGYKVRTLTAFYYKSFVKIYAQYLGLDANHVVSLIPTHHPKPAADHYPLRRQGTAPRPVATGAGAHRVEGVRSWNLLAHPIVLKKKKKVFKAVALVAGMVIAVFLASILVRKVVSLVKVNAPAKAASVKPVTPFKNAPKPAVKKVVSASKAIEEKTSEARVAGSKVVEPKPVDVKPAVAKPVVAPVAENPVEKKAEEKTVKPATPAPAVKQVSITVRAQATTWVKVDVDDTGTAFQGKIKKGSSATWRGTKRIVLSANDIGALEVEVNGRGIAKLARNYLKAKRVIVTPEGLSVDK